MVGTIDIKQPLLSGPRKRGKKFPTSHIWESLFGGGGESFCWAVAGWLIGFNLSASSSDWHLLPKTVGRIILKLCQWENVL